MLREFFWQCSYKKRAWAHAGLVLIVCHALMRAWVKSLMNKWMEKFYDAGGAATEVGSGEEDALREGAARIASLLWEFSVLCLPSVVVHPIFKLLTNRWVLSWRLVLVRKYIAMWKPEEQSIENGAQR